jgi:hypothetical protein
MADPLSEVAESDPLSNYLIATATWSPLNGNQTIHPRKHWDVTSNHVKILPI